MHKFLILFLPLLFIFASCEKEAANDTTDLSDETLIEALATDPAATEVAYNQLPAAAREEIETEFFETFVERVMSVNQRGFIVELANGETLYCRPDGRFLTYNATFRPNGVFDRHPLGVCFRRLRQFGERIPLTELSTSITDYTAANYPDNVIRVAKTRGDSTLVGLSRGIVLLFGADDVFINEWNILDHCTNRCSLVRPAVIQTIRTYISANYADVTIRNSCARPNRIFVFGHTDEGRIILIFDTEGNFIEARP